MDLGVAEDPVGAGGGDGHGSEPVEADDGAEAVVVVIGVDGDGDVGALVVAPAEVTGVEEAGREAGEGSGVEVLTAPGPQSRGGRVETVTVLAGEGPGAVQGVDVLVERGQDRSGGLGGEEPVHVHPVGCGGEAQELRLVRGQDRRVGTVGVGDDGDPGDRVADLAHASGRCDRQGDCLDPGPLGVEQVGGDPAEQPRDRRGDLPHRALADGTGEPGDPGRGEVTVQRLTPGDRGGGRSGGEPGPDLQPARGRGEPLDPGRVTPVQVTGRLDRERGDPVGDAVQHRGQLEQIHARERHQ